MSDSNKRKSIRDIPIPIRKNGGQVSDVKPVEKKQMDSYTEDHHIPKKELREEKHINPVRSFKKISRETDSIKINRNRGDVDLPNEISRANSHKVSYRERDLDLNTYPKNDSGEKPFNPYPTDKMKNNKKTYTKLIIISFVGLFALVIVIMSLFKSASIDIRNRVENIANVDFEKTLVNELVSVADSDVFNKIDISLDSKVSVESDEEEFVREKASGTVTVYNEYSESPQQIVTNTRFESPEGYIYRAKNAFTIPGYTTIDGKIVPGTVDVDVAADLEGPKYNIDKTNFTIPGFSGDPQFEKIYAKSKTNMTGGLDGVKKIITEENLERASSELELLAKNKILEEAKDKFGEDFVYVESGQDYVYSEITQSEISGNTVTLTMNATGTFIVIDKKEISEVVAKNYISNYDADSEVLIENIKNLKLDLNPDFENNTDKEISLNISGNDIKVIWQNDIEKIKESISGEKKEILNEIIVDFPGIVGFENVINRPFWSGKFPKDIESIDINIIN